MGRALQRSLTLVLLGSLAASSCGGAPREVERPRPPQDILPPFELAQPGVDEVAPLEARLDERFHAPVRTLAAAVVEGGETFLLVAFESFSAWQGYRRLEPWEQDDAPWSAAGEYDLWMEGLEVAGLADEAQRQVDQRFAECANAPDEGCAEVDLWEAVIRRLDTPSCLADRVAVAAFRPDGEAPPELVATVLEGRRCGAGASGLLPHELDGRPGVELLVELRWREGDLLEAGELLILGGDLDVQLRRRLSQGAPGRGGADRRESRYWFEAAEGAGAPTLVIEELTPGESCELRGCSWFSREGGAAAVDLLLGPPCFPRGGEGDCPMTPLARQTLSFDQDHSLWL